MLRFGILGRPHGVRGECVLRVFNPEGFHLEGVRLPVAAELVAGSTRKSVQLTAVRPFGGDLLVRIGGVDSREAASAVTNFDVFLSRELLPPLDPGEAYVEDLLGCTVSDQHGRIRGIVESMFWNGAHDVLRVVAQGGEELLVPAVPEFLRDIDLDARRLVIDDHE